MVLLIDEAWILQISLRSITNRGLRRALLQGIDFFLAFSILFSLKGFACCGRLDRMNLRDFTRTR